MAELIMTEEGSTPSTPGTNKWKAYFKSNGMYIVDDTGAELGPFVAGSTFGPTIAALTAKASLVDADKFIIGDSAASNASKSVLWSVIKSVMRTFMESYWGDSQRTKYIISPSVSSNNLTLAIKYIDGNDATTTNKIVFRVGNTEYTLSAAVSFTKNAATNWCNLGSAELAALPHDLFVYAIDETGASAGLKFGFSRIPYATTMGDFVNTSTNEKYIAGNWTNFNSTDAVVNIGRFRAQLSASASFNWSIPTAKVINRPIFLTDTLNWTPTLTGYSANPTNTVYEYRIENNYMECWFRESSNGTSNATSITETLPFTCKTLANAEYDGQGAGIDNGGALTTTVRGVIASAGTTIAFFPNGSAGSTWTNALGKAVRAAFIRYPIG